MVESTVHDMPIFKIEHAGNPTKFLYNTKINKQKFRALLDSGSEISLIHPKVYKSLKNKLHFLVKETNCITTISKMGFYQCGWWEGETGT